MFFLEVLFDLSNDLHPLTGNPDLHRKSPSPRPLFFYPVLAPEKAADLKFRVPLDLAAPPIFLVRSLCSHPFCSDPSFPLPPFAGSFLNAAPARTTRADKRYRRLVIALLFFNGALFQVSVFHPDKFRVLYFFERSSFASKNIWLSTQAKGTLRCFCVRSRGAILMLIFFLRWPLPCVRGDYFLLRPSGLAS